MESGNREASKESAGVLLRRTKNRIRSTVMEKEWEALKGPSACSHQLPHRPPSERACSSDSEAAASQQRGRSSGSGDRKCQLHTAPKSVGHVVMHNSCRLDSCSGRYVSTVSNRGDGARRIKAYKFGPPIWLTLGVALAWRITTGKQVLVSTN